MFCSHLIILSSQKQHQVKSFSHSALQLANRVPFLCAGDQTMSGAPEAPLAPPAALEAPAAPLFAPKAPKLDAAVWGDELNQWSIEAAVEKVLSGKGFPVTELVALIASYTTNYKPTIALIMERGMAMAVEFIPKSHSGSSKGRDWMIAIVSTWNKNLFTKIALQPDGAASANPDPSAVMSPFIGAGPGFASGTKETTLFSSPITVLCDPIQPGGYYLFDRLSIRYYDEINNKVGLVVGKSVQLSLVADDGFINISSAVISSDGLTIWVTDQYSGVIRRVDLTAADRAARGQLPPTAHKIRFPIQVVWDRSPHQNPNTALYINSSNEKLWRFDVSVPSNPIKSVIQIPGLERVESMVSTPTGLLIMTVGNTGGLTIIDPKAGTLTPLVLSSDEGWYRPVALTSDARYLYTTQGNSSIRCVSLPSLCYPLAPCPCPVCTPSAH